MHKCNLIWSSSGNNDTPLKGFLSTHEYFSKYKYLMLGFIKQKEKGKRNNLTLYWIFFSMNICLKWVDISSVNKYYHFHGIKSHWKNFRRKPRSFDKVKVNGLSLDLD